MFEIGETRENLYHHHLQMIKTIRISDSTVLDETAHVSMQKLLSEWDKTDFNARLLEANNQNLGKKLTFQTEFSNADDLHKNFRMFCKYGWLDAIKRLVLSEGADFFTFHGSKQYNETGLTLAAKFGRQDCVALLLSVGSDVMYVMEVMH